MELAVDQTIKEFGRIDFVIAGAAGNFLATIDVFPPRFPCHRLLSESIFERFPNGHGNRYSRIL